MDKNELTSLKQRADLMGIKYNANVTVESLKEKINEKLNNNKETVDESSDDFDINKYRKEQLKLIRCRINCLDAEKNDVQGMFISVCNKYLGKITKYIPIHMAADSAGYHIPYCIYKSIKNDYKYISRSKHNGSDLQYDIDEKPLFDIVVLPPLTKKELEELASEQKATSRLLD